MKTKTQIIFTVILVCFTRIIFAQSTISGNVRPSTTAFTGWDGTGANSGDLDIKNDFVSPARNINFFTNTAQIATFTSPVRAKLKR